MYMQCLAPEPGEGQLAKEGRGDRVSQGGLPGGGDIGLSFRGSTSQAARSPGVKVVS